MGGNLGPILLLVGSLATVAVGLYGIITRNRRNSPEQRAADAQVYTSFTGGLSTLSGEVTRLTMEQAKANTVIAGQASELLQLRSQVARIAELEQQLGKALAQVEQLTVQVGEQAEQLTQQSQEMEGLRGENRSLRAENRVLRDRLDRSTGGNVQP